MRMAPRGKSTRIAKSPMLMMKMAMRISIRVAAFRRFISIPSRIQCEAVGCGRGSAAREQTGRAIHRMRGDRPRARTNGDDRRVAFGHLHARVAHPKKKVVVGGLAVDHPA